jgi:hypothetical protein
MVASVGKQNAVVILDEPPAIAVHPESIIGDAVQKNYYVSIRFLGPHKPSAKEYAVLSHEFHIAKLYRIPVRSGLCIAVVGLTNRGTGWVQCDVAKADASEQCSYQIEHGQCEGQVPQNGAMCPHKLGILAGKIAITLTSVQ